MTRRIFLTGTATTAAAGALATGFADPSSALAKDATAASANVADAALDRALARLVRHPDGPPAASPRIRKAQFEFRPGSSEPTGPGRNSVGLALFRYQTPGGTVYGHTGNTAGYTQFLAATGDGRRSMAVSVNAQITPTVHPERFPGLQLVFDLTVAAALACPQSPTRSSNPPGRPSAAPGWLDPPVMGEPSIVSGKQVAERRE